MEDLKKVVGQRLQLLRLEKNLTQEQMGVKLNLSTSAYCKLEYGETDLTLTRLNQIAAIFNLSPVELFSKIEGNYYFNDNKDCSFVGIARDGSTVNVEEKNNNLKELLKANTHIIEMLCKRVDLLEEELKLSKKEKYNL